MIERHGRDEREIPRMEFGLTPPPKKTIEEEIEDCIVWNDNHTTEIDLEATIKKLKTLIEEREDDNNNTD